jgi:hypothetical protein
VAGRFVSEDPAYNGQNWFAYCGDNPIGAVDPTGKLLEPVPAIVGSWWWLN